MQFEVAKPPPDFLAASPPYTTAALPGIGGVLRASPQDFEVEEIPEEHPCGSGDHLYVWIEKCGLATDVVVQRATQVFGVPADAVGFAGMKDRHAVTRQIISLPASVEARLPQLETEGLKVLGATRHTHKLKTGHLAGNRFRIVVRAVRGADALLCARAIADLLRLQGVANFYGEQRFGVDGATLAMGLALLRGERCAQLGRTAPSRRALLRRLALSSVQSALFNRYLGCRLADGLLHHLIEGEVVLRRSSGVPSVVADVAADQARFEAREVVPGGPMFGPKMRQVRAAAARREAAVLAEAGLTLLHFLEWRKLLPGTRRPTLLWVDDLSVRGVASDGDWAALECRFSLPAGSYATIVMRELMKND